MRRLVDDEAVNSPTGAAVTKAQSLNIQAPDPTDPETVYLAKQIEKRARGSLTVAILEDYPSLNAANETRLVRAVRAGREDFAVVPARAWPAGGVRAFAAMQAPFVIGTYETARAALAGPAGASLTDALRRAGVMPLALVPAELRRVLATRELTTVSRFKGARVRIYDNPVTADTLRSLGAKPRQRLTADDVLPGIQGGTLDGVETAPIYALDNGYGKAAKHLTGYALFDKAYTFVASPSAWKRLSAAQQSAVRAGAADTVRYAATLAQRDDADLAALCGTGVRVDVPTSHDLRALSHAEAPVIAALNRDPDAGPVLQLLRATPGAGPRALNAPTTCMP
jgi:TRAP-type C4-dicarboxylate transport system substrate-binding protein